VGRGVPRPEIRKETGAVKQEEQAANKEWRVTPLDIPRQNL
jgi:hypothetical protein